MIAFLRRRRSDTGTGVAPSPRGRLRRVRGWLIAVDLLILGGVLAVQQWPLLTVEEIEVEGPGDWHDRARNAVVLPADSNLFSVDIPMQERRLNDEFGSLAECRVKIVLPDRLRIRLVPTAPMLWTDEGGGLDAGGDHLASLQVAGTVPVWRTSSAGRKGLADGCSAVAGWSEVLKADPRFGDVVSEWFCTPRRGWEMVAAGGRTRIILGWSDLAMRARRVSHLLSRSDSVLTWASEIDARFGAHVVVRPGLQSHRLAGEAAGSKASTSMNISMAALDGRAPSMRGGGL